MGAEFAMGFGMGLWPTACVLLLLAPVNAGHCSRKSGCSTCVSDASCSFCAGSCQMASDRCSGIEATMSSQCAGDTHAPSPPPPTPVSFACACEAVEVVLSGSALVAQSRSAGTYVRMNGVTQDGRVVYQQSGGSKYLFFSAPSSDWLVGSDYLQNTANLQSVDDLSAQCPEAAGPWEYFSTTKTWESGGVAVGCPSPPPPPPPPPLPLPPFACACEAIEVVLTGDANVAQSSKAGTYVRMNGVTQDGRAVYQQSGGSQYLFFRADSSDWLVGPDYTTSIGVLASRDDRDAQCPEAAGDWKYYISGTGWVSASAAEVAVDCPSTVGAECGDDVTWTISNTSESCDDACGAINLPCAALPSDAAGDDSCTKLLANHFGKNCGQTSQLRQTIAAPYIDAKQICYWSHSASDCTCDGTFVGAERFCPCHRMAPTPPPSPPPSPPPPSSPSPSTPPPPAFPVDDQCGSLGLTWVISDLRAR